MIDETSISEQEILNDPENIEDIEEDIIEDEDNQSEASKNNNKAVV